MSEFAAWMRLDVPGRAAALLRPNGGGWLLQGAAAFDHEYGPAAVAYQVEVDARWETRRGLIRGLLGDKAIDNEIRRDDRGWRLNGAAVKGLDHLVDLDFGFTPATNVLQLSRIALKLGQSAEVPVAWLDLDRASLTELPQRYERRSETSYWYEAPTVPYRALLEIAPNGFVRSYPGLWRLVA
ncbi:MAG TPA: putative glycolipid-binding domain-containing protein [Roseiarcus sp.]